MPIRSKIKPTLWVATATLAVGVLAGCGSPSASVVATYNGGTITQTQMDTQVNLMKLLYPTLSVTNAIKTQILDEYIVYDRLLVNKAQQAGIKVPQSQVNNVVLQWKQSEISQGFSGNSQSFDAKLQTLKLTNTDIANLVQNQLMLQAYAKTLVKTIPLSQQTQYYQQNLAQFATVTERHILTKSLPLAQKLQKELQNGGSWKILAKEYSQDTGSKNNGGEYVNQNPTQWVTPFKDHAMTQPIGQIGAPFNTTYGYFVMQVLKRTVAPFKQEQSTILSTLTQQQESTAMSAVAAQIQKAANIKVTLPTA